MDLHESQEAVYVSDSRDMTRELQETVRMAYERRIPLSILGGNSKRFFGRPARGEPFSLAAHRGIVNYEPAELVITARSGTPLDEVETLLRKHGQMLAFEPPHFGVGATLGGTIACGISGPRRPYAGAARDHLLGVRCLSGEGRLLRFGGEVVKNVAGFDAFRLMAGALGTLGVLLEVSLKVLPRPEHTVTLAFECRLREALNKFNDWHRSPLPISAGTADDARLYVRLEGSVEGVQAVRDKLGGDIVPGGMTFWDDLREHRHPFFADNDPLWRLSLPPATPPLSIVGRWLIDWGGAQRWLKTALPPKLIRETAARHGGHAQLFRGGERDGAVFHPLPVALLDLHKNLKQAFDPRGILNPQRMYREF
ncbi:MAG: glycolate oxidase subunit GlcE [Gammaproteobacteria bacterium]|nr:glycolate oxidase subunit GlcE [Gammaproteobacteria bacterium]